MSELKKMSDELLNDVAGGKEKEYRVQNSNFCPRCLSAGYIVKHVEQDGTELRECKVCHQEYKYRRY